VKMLRLYPTNLGGLQAEPYLKVKGPSSRELPKECWHREDDGRVEYLPAAASEKFPDINKERILCSWKFLGKGAEDIDRISLMSKMRPHSVHDLMLMNSGDKLSQTYAEHGTAARSFYWRAIYRLVHFLSEESNIVAFGLSPSFAHFVFNIDTDTLDREGAISEKRFHIHINVYNREEIERIKPIPFDSIEDVSIKVNLLDPVSFLSIPIIRDALGSVKNTGPTAYDCDPATIIARRDPIGYTVRLTEGWEQITSDSFSSLIAEIDNDLAAAFTELRYAFHDRVDAPPLWHRHPLLPYDEILRRLRTLGWLSSESFENLALLARTLRDLSSETIGRLRQHPKRLVRHLAYAGLSYSISLISRDYSSIRHPLCEAREVLLVIQAKLFSIHGGAGVFYMPGVPIVRIAKCSIPYTEADRESRRRFQQDAAKWINDDGC